MSDHKIDAIQSAIDRRGVHGLQLRVMAVCAAVLALDGYDIVSMGFALPSLAEAWHVPTPSLTTALVMGNVGMLVGALVSGPLGDRLGRKPVFMGNVLAFGLFSVLSAYCATLPMLSVMRFLTGLGLGGGVPLAIALCSDFSPQRHQAKLVSIMTIGVQAGTVGGGMIISRIIPSYGWQSVFIAGGVLPLLILPGVYRWLPESIQFTTAAGRVSRESASLMQETRETALLPSSTSILRKNPVMELFRNGLASTTVLLWIIFACNFLTTYLISLWLPTILRSSGFSIGDAVFATTMFSFGGGLVALVLGWPIARFGSERVLTVMLLFGLVATVWLGMGTHTYNGYLVAVFCSGVGISGSQAGMNALSGAVYPALIRSSGSGWALGVGRLGNIFGPLLGGVLLAYGLPPSYVFLCAAVPVAITAACMFALGRVRFERDGATPRTRMVPARS